MRYEPKTVDPIPPPDFRVSVGVVVFERQVEGGPMQINVRCEPGAASSLTTGFAPERIAKFPPEILVAMDTLFAFLEAECASDWEFKPTK